MYLSWRLLQNEPAELGFNVYVTGGAQTLPRRSATPSRSAARRTLWLATCVLPTRHGGPCGRSSTAWKVLHRLKSAHAAEPYVSIKLDGDHTFQKVGIADLDGDGRYDFVHQAAEQQHRPVREVLEAAAPARYKLEAYRHDGKFLWRHDLGWSIEQGIWYSPYVVYDLDGDGRAEVAVKTGEGDPRDEDGRVQTGPEYLTILDGADRQADRRASTGRRAKASTRRRAVQLRLAQPAWRGLSRRQDAEPDRRARHVQHHQAGRLPARAAASWSSSGGGTTRKRAARRTGARAPHWMHAADVDGDGRDEVVLGSVVLDDNGTAAVDHRPGPSRPLLRRRDRPRPARAGDLLRHRDPRRRRNGMCLVDAATGKILWGIDEPTRHVHSYGLCSDIDAAHPGSECYSADTDPQKDFAFGLCTTAAARCISEENLGGFGAADRLLGRRPAARVAPRRQALEVQGPDAGDQDRRAAVIAVADVLGDWREEIITSRPGEMRIYTTTIPATDRRVCLMQDPLYRMDVVVAAMGYYQVPMTSYDLATGKR